MNPALAGAAILAVAGVGLLAIPDDGRRLVAFSESHGLTALDGSGAALLVAGWLLALRTLTRDGALRARARREWARGWLPLAVGLGTGLVLAGAARDFEGWWVLGAAVLAGAQLALVLRRD